MANTSRAACRSARASPIQLVLAKFLAVMVLVVVALAELLVLDQAQTLEVTGELAWPLPDDLGAVLDAAERAYAKLTMAPRPEKAARRCSTVLTLVLIPSLLVILNDFRRLVFRYKFGRWPTREEVEPARTRHRDPLAGDAAPSGKLRTV